MKSKAIMMLASTMACLATLFSSCTKDNDITAEKTEDTEKQDSVQTPDTYTVMLYGCSDTKLDQALAYNLTQLQATGKKERVNFAGLVKFSPKIQAAQEKLNGTRYLTMTDKGMTNQRRYESTYRMDNPENLANFIKETKEKMPADKYILVLWNHGSEFGIGDKPVQSSYPESEGSRALLFDESNAGVAMSTFELEKAIKDSDTKFDLMYLDVCNNGMIETYYQLKDCADYIMAAMQLTPGIGGNYTQLLNDLQEKETLEEAIEDYVPKCVSTWKTTGTTSADLECYDMSYMDELANYMALATEQLTKLRTAQTKGSPNDLNNAQIRRVQWFATTYDTFMAKNNNVSTDFYSALTQLASTTMDGRLSSYATQTSNIIDKMTVAESSIGLPDNMERISMGMTWPTINFKTIINVNSTLSAYYKQAIDGSAFAQATGWNQYLNTCETPYVFYINYITSESGVWYYEGIESAYKYSWEVTFSVPDDIEQTDDIQETMKSLNTGFASLMADKQYVLRHGAAILMEARQYVLKNSSDLALQLSAVDICVQLQGEPDEKDTDKDKYDTTLSYSQKIL